MKNAKVIISVAMASFMTLSLTAAAQTLEEFTDSCGAMSVAQDGEHNDDEMSSLIPWYDMLGITVEQLREEMAQNPPEEAAETASPDSRDKIDPSTLTPEEQSEYLSSLTPEELASLIDYEMVYEPLSPEEQAAFELECPQKHTPEESREIRRRLAEVTHPGDLICSDHGEIYVDIRWRDKKAPNDTNCIDDEFAQLSEDFAVSPTNIIDDDDRVKPSTTNVAPLNYTALIRMYYYNSEGRGITATGSAFFVAKNLLLTAGHCACSPEYGEPYKIEIYPGGYESGLPKKVSYKSFANEDFVNGTAPCDDYGTIYVVADVSSGYFILNSPTTSSLSSADIYHYGYPRDKPSTMGSGFYELWISYGKVKSEVNDTYFLHNADEVKGNSGGPIILSSNKKTAGVNSASLDGYDWNLAARITPDVIDFVNRTK